MAQPARVAIVRATHLGDLLCAIPMLRSLRRLWPAARVTLVGLPWARILPDRFSAYLDDFLEFPGWPGIPERDVDADRLADFLRQARAMHFDLAIQAHGDGTKMNRFLNLLQARETVGFHPPGEPSPGPGFIAYPTDRHEALRLLALAARLGARDLDPALEFPVAAADRAAAAELRAELKVDGRAYACLHPGGSTAARRWDARGFAGVADELTATGLEVVLTGVSGEAAIAADVARRARHPLRSAVGRTSLGSLAALIADSRLVVSNDTGVSHLAAALRVPSVVVFTGSDPARWAPLASRLHRVVDPARSGGHGSGRRRAVEVILAVRQQLRASAGASA